ncbi:amino acid adenylation domain-containing protein [Mucilaginibacter sp.]|uniref:amino acid adenylation domain-containing protein n=1 Tax=Mucilaginibacter sp. TaxID=1882438 RepID=UPI00262B36FB|nr:amino acid adenylation domain-containing protein [Mucilaginibacter sp.]MDB4925332.1 amino acid adenylation protein [Mucilaginibacter sp.]
MLDIYIDNNLKDAIKLLCKKENCTINDFFIAAFNILLLRYTGQENIFFDQILIEDKNIKHDEDNCINVKNYSTQLISQTIFLDFLKSQQLALSEAIDTDKLKKNTFNEAASSREKISIDFCKSVYIIQSVLNKQDNVTHTNALVNKLLTRADLFHIGLILKETGSFTKISILYNPAISDEEYITAFKENFVTLLHAIVANPTVEIGSYNILTSAVFNSIVYEFNNTITAYPKDKAIHNLFEEQVIHNPQAIALLKGINYITYNELNKKANQLAHYLIKKGLKPEDNVGLLVTRNFDMIIGMLGILKAGGAYVPIDHNYPVDRQHYIYNHSSAKMLIADDDYPMKDIINVSDYIRTDLDVINDMDDSNPSIIISSKQLAYTIYTSGSTGQPKGVMIEHHSAVNLVLWVNKKFNVNINDKLLFVTSMCFDLSVYDIFGMLAAGGTLVIAEKREIQNVKTLQDMLLLHKITFWDSVPTTMEYLIKNLEKERSDYSCLSLKTVFLSGDWIPVDLPSNIKRFFPKANVVSLGGATEGTVWSNYFIVDENSKIGNSIPYGKPIDNNFFYILNEHLQPVPINVVGDLYIGGVGVARGYANDIQKTNSSFIPDPFNQKAGGMMYKTGDLGKMLPDLNMEFIGRKDNQVKINGFRIELGEIENALKSSPIISNAVVLAKNDQYGNKRLVSYLVPKGNVFDREKVILFLKKTLPDYMIPAIWVDLKELPLTSNGKIDRNSLSTLDDTTLIKKKSVEQPTTKNEQILFNIWKNNLNLNISGIHDNFFELGGHSLMAVQMLSQFKKITGKIFPLDVLYQYSDIKALAKYVDNDKNSFDYKYLVAIKAKGNNDPLYIIQGDSGNILNFSNLIKYIDREQPLYGLKAIGLDGVHAPFESLADIAGHYIKEIIQHNPSGPYLLAGYSSGAYVAVEMRKQMAAAGKQVKLLIIDADAGMTEYKHKYKLIPKKIKRHYPEIFTFLKSSILQSSNLIKGNISGMSTYFTHDAPINRNLNGHSLFDEKLIKSKRIRAFKNYEIEPFNDEVYLLKAKISVHYVDHGKFLGWEQYAKKGVNLFEIPGDHFSILLPPFVEEFTSVLQKNLTRA